MFLCHKLRLFSSETPPSSPSSVVLSYICNCLYVHSGKNIVNLGNSSLASNYVMMFSSSKNLPFLLIVSLYHKTSENFGSEVKLLLFPGFFCLVLFGLLSHALSPSSVLLLWVFLLLVIVVVTQHAQEESSCCSFLHL